MRLRQGYGGTSALPFVGKAAEDGMVMPAFFPFLFLIELGEEFFV